MKKTEAHAKGRHVPRQLRLVVDVAMTFVYLLQMAPYQMGGWYHEVAGLSFGALLVVHHVLNVRWLQVEVRRHDWMQVVLDVALLVCVLGIAGSGMAMAQHVRLVRIEGMTHVARTTHAFFTYAGLMLVSLHVGLHVPHGWLEGLSSGLRALVAAVLLAGGAYAFASLGVASKLSWGMSFPDGMTPLAMLVSKHVLLALPFVGLGCGLSIREGNSR